VRHLQGVGLSQAVAAKNAPELAPGLPALGTAAVRTLRPGPAAAFIWLLAELMGTGTICSQAARPGRRNKDTHHHMLKSSFVLKDEKGRH